MNEIKAISADAYAYLAAIPACHWSRHAFPTRCKSEMLLNSCCESFNNVLRDARGKPIISLMEWIGSYVMQRCAAKREGLNQIKGVVMPSVMKVIEDEAQKVHSMRVIVVNVMEFEVDDGDDSYVVNIEDKNCLCNKWRFTGIPCRRVLACTVKRKLDFAPYVHEAYYVSTYANLCSNIPWYAWSQALANFSIG
ncbi:unnamed protein product [Amaranthus hypochondriacus]